MKEERIFWKGKKSRKAFLHYYIVSILFLALTGVLLFGIIEIGFLAAFADYLSYLLIGLSILFVILVEIKRLMVKYSITENRIIKEEGIINKKTDYIPYQMIEKILFDNKWHDRILGIGNIEIDTGEAQFWLLSVNKPREVENIINKAISRVTRRYYNQGNSSDYKQNNYTQRNYRRGR